MYRICVFCFLKQRSAYELRVGECSADGCSSDRPCLDSKRNGIGDPEWQRRTIMAQRESTQHKLDRVRAPRVQLTYDVEIGDAIPKQELPFVAGVLGAFTGKPEEPLAMLQERKFVNVDKDNFDAVLSVISARMKSQCYNRRKDAAKN